MPWSLRVLIGSLLLSLLLYGRTLGHAFVYDDVIFLNREDLRSPSSLLSSVWYGKSNQRRLQNEGYRPVAIFTYAVQLVLFGESPGAFHGLNIIINALVISLVYWLTRELFNQPVIAIFASLLFAFLPIHSENVAAIKYREDMLSALFMMLSWLYFVHARKQHHRVVRLCIASSVCFFLSLLSKELLILSPLIIFWTDASAWRGWGKRLLLYGMVFGVPILIWGCMRLAIYGSYAFERSSQQLEFNPLQREGLPVVLATTGKIAFTYVTKSLIPYHLSANYAYNHFPIVTNILSSWESIAGYILLIIFLYSSIRYRRTPLGVGTTVFLVSYIPLSKVFLTAADIFSERWMYFPSFGLILPVAWLLAACYRRYRYAAIVAMAVILVGYGAVVLSRVVVWENEETLYQSMLRDAPDSAWAHYSMANYYFKNGKIGAAKPEIERADDILPNVYDTLTLRGGIAAVEGNQDEAMKYFQQAIRLDPTRPTAHLNYAVVLSKKGLYIESMRHIYDQFMKDPRDPHLRFLMAVNFYKMGEYEKASPFFDWTNTLTLEEKISQLETF